jgi:hypothetical protein
VRLPLDEDGTEVADQGPAAMNFSVLRGLRDMEETRGLELLLSEPDVFAWLSGIDDDASAPLWAVAVASLPAARISDAALLAAREWSP